MLLVVCFVAHSLESHSTIELKSKKIVIYISKIHDLLKLWEINKNGNLVLWIRRSKYKSLKYNQL